MNVLGFDPGLEATAWALVTVVPEPRLLAWGVLVTPEQDPATLRANVTDLFRDWAAERPNVCAVESARGFIVAKRDADPVLRDSAQSGRLVGLLAARGLPVVEMPAFSDRQGYNWRGLLGCAGMTDEGVRVQVGRLLSGPLPAGSHVVDAAGVSLATAQRLHGRGLTAQHSEREICAGFYRLNRLEEGVLDTNKIKRAARKQTRAITKKVTSLGHEIDPALLGPARRKSRK